MEVEEKLINLAGLGLVEEPQKFHLSRAFCQCPSLKFKEVENTSKYKIESKLFKSEVSLNKLDYLSTYFKVEYMGCSIQLKPLKGVEE